MKHKHDRGLAHDLEVMLKQTSRRRLLCWIGGASLLPLIGCGDDETSDDSLGSAGSGGSQSSGTGGGTSAAGSSGGGASSCTKIPEETAGPYPGDGSNGPNALVLSGIIRSDIRASIAGLSGTAEGVPLTVKLKLVKSGTCEALAGYAIYLWHCDRDGQYSLYTITTQNYLRGVQETDSDGNVTFTTIFPGCYSGRMPHIHFEMYPSVAKAVDSKTKVATSQLGFPAAPCNEVYATSGYEASVSNFSRISFASDNVFSDGTQLQIASVTGNVTDGYVATLTIAINA